jgi:hypothetical protein
MTSLSRKELDQAHEGQRSAPSPLIPRNHSHNPAGDGTDMTPVAALFVETDGCYFNLPGVSAWDLDRDARQYAGPHPVVAHPPCQRWGRFWHGSTRKPHQYKLGDDNGCFAAALAAVRKWGGVLEHPKDSLAWAHFGLNRPPRNGGWIAADFEGGWTCCVEQGHYGHLARKATWLYAQGVDLPELLWGQGAQRIHPIALAKHGYAKARRIGMMAMVGGKDKTRIRNATPIEFRDVLLSIARTARRSEARADGTLIPMARAESGDDHSSSLGIVAANWREVTREGPPASFSFGDCSPSGLSRFDLGCLSLHACMEPRRET